MDTQLFIHPSELSEDRFEPVSNEGFCPKKPNGGLWTSTWDDESSDWVRVASGVDVEKDCSWWLLTPREDARVLTIASVEDLEAAIERFPFEDPVTAMLRTRGAWLLHLINNMSIDFEAAAVEYDAIHLTKLGLSQCRLPQPGRPCINTWDCESTIWLHWAFESVELYKEKPMSDEIKGATRAETGPLQFGEDWPGVFIRGDNALALADYLEMALEDRLDAIGQAMVGQFIYTLRGCHTRTPGHDQELTKLKDYPQCVDGAAMSATVLVRERLDALFHALQDSHMSIDAIAQLFRLDSYADKQDLFQRLQAAHEEEKKNGENQTD